MILHGKPGASASLTIRGARVLDPGAGLDALLDVKIEKGVIAELAQPSSKKSAGKGVAAEGLVLAPAFVDPHVHLRTPGREDERRSLRAPPRPRPAATAPFWPCPTPRQRSTMRPCLEP